MSEFELFHLPGACSRVTLTALEWTQTPFELTIPTDRADLAKPEYKARNPFGQVPVLVIDGRPLTENVAILIHLARRFPEAGLLPKDAWAEAIAISRLAVCATQLHPITGRILFPQNFCDFSPEASARTREQGLQMMRARLGAIEQTLVGDWWAGDSFSIADIYLIWFTNRLVRLNLDDLSAFPKLKDHLARVQAQPVAERVIARERRGVEDLEARGAAIPAFLRPGMIN